LEREQQLVNKLKAEMKSASNSSTQLVGCKETPQLACKVCLMCTCLARNQRGVNGLYLVKMITHRCAAPFNCFLCTD